ncbi:MAG: TadE family type IV pilus minor pilin [Rhodoglobus sp.]
MIAERGSVMAERRSVIAERGSVTAEFAVALPAVVLVLACCLSGVQVAGQQLRLQDAAASAARAAARGGDAASASRLVPGAGLTRYTEGDLVCVRLTAASTALVGTIMALTLSATSCALGGGK